MELTGGCRRVPCLSHSVLTCSLARICTREWVRVARKPQLLPGPRGWTQVGTTCLHRPAVRARRIKTRAGTYHPHTHTPTHPVCTDFLLPFLVPARAVTHSALWVKGMNLSVQKNPYVKPEAGRIDLGKSWLWGETVICSLRLPLHPASGQIWWAGGMSAGPEPEAGGCL